MLYRNVECPHCGNEISVSNTSNNQKCCWCRRLVSAKFVKVSKKRIVCNIEPVDFPEYEYNEERENHNGVQYRSRNSQKPYKG